MVLNKIGQAVGGSLGGSVGRQLVGETDIRDEGGPVETVIRDRVPVDPGTQETLDKGTLLKKKFQADSVESGSNDPSGSESGLTPLVLLGAAAVAAAVLLRD